MILTALNVGRRLVSRRRSASDELGDTLREIGSSVDDLLDSVDRTLSQFTSSPRKAPLVIGGLAAAVGGYLVGRKTGASNAPATGSSYVAFPDSPGNAEASTAVAASRPQPPEAESAPVKAAQAQGAGAVGTRSSASASARSNGEATGTGSRSTKAKSAGSGRAKKSSSRTRSTKAAPKRAKPSKS